MKSYPEITWLRGIAILGVVLIHTCAYFTRISGVNGLVASLVSFDVFAHFAVPLFIFISGFVLTLGATPQMRVRDFYARRFSRTLFPYLIFSLLYFAVFQTGLLQGNFHFSGQDLAFRLLVGDAYYHLWYFILIFQFYLVYPLIIKIVHDSRFEKYILPAGIFLQMLYLFFLPDLSRAWVSVVPGFWGYVLNGLLFDKRFFVSHLGYFLLGAYMARQELKGAERKRIGLPSALLVSGLIAAGLVAGSWYWTQGIAQFGSFNQIPASFLRVKSLTDTLLHLSTLLCLWLLPLRRTSPWIHGLGEASYGIYLVHVFVLEGLAYTLTINGITPEQIIFYPLLFAGSLAGAWGLTLLIEKLPFRKYLIGS